MNLNYHRPAAGGKTIVARLAFTMIEILIAITIFTLVMAAIYSTWTMIMRASRVAQEATAQAQRERIALHTLEDSLTCIESFQASLQYYSFFVENGDQPTLSFTARVPDGFPRNGRFGDFRVRRLTYTVEAVQDLVTRNSEKDLVLRQYPILTGIDSDEQSTPYVLARNVQSFAVECWDTNAMAWTDQWLETNSIPPTLRVTLVLGKKNTQSGQPGPGLTLSSVIAVPSQSMPVQVQTPGRGGSPGAIVNTRTRLNAGGNQ